MLSDPRGRVWIVSADRILDKLCGANVFGVPFENQVQAALRDSRQADIAGILPAGDMLSGAVDESVKVVKNADQIPQRKAVRRNFVPLNADC